MTSTVTSQPVFIPGTIYNGTVIDIRVLDDAGPSDPVEIAYELGLWLSGLESFLTRFEHLFTDQAASGPESKQWQRAMRLTRAGLLRCSELQFRLCSIEGDSGVPSEMILDVSNVVRTALLLNEGLGKKGSLRSDEWANWRDEVFDKFSGSNGVRYFQALTRHIGQSAIPEAVDRLITKVGTIDPEKAEVCGILREFASIHSALSVVGRMLRNDEPLKPTLLLFAFVYEKTQHLIGQINHRLSKMKSEETDVFIALDSASYTASLEIKKAFNQELSGVVGVRPAHLVYAHVEVAHSLLSASFEEIIASFARTLDPSTKVADIFASFRTKLEQSLILRAGLVKTLRAVKEAEEEPTDDVVRNMRNSVELFNHEAFHFLYYKDKETVERFTEEVQFTNNVKDLVPLLHRFGAYLETLLGAVSMRAVLAGHPLEESESLAGS